MTSFKGHGCLTLQVAFDGLVSTDQLEVIDALSKIFPNCPLYMQVTNSKGQKLYSGTFHNTKGA